MCVHGCAVPAGNDLSIRVTEAFHRIVSFTLDSVIVLLSVRRLYQFDLFSNLMCKLNAGSSEGELAETLLVLVLA